MLNPTDPDLVNSLIENSDNVIDIRELIEHRIDDELYAILFMGINY